MSPHPAQQPTPRRPRRASFGRRLLLASGALLFLVVLATLALILSFRHAMHASLPTAQHELDGTLSIIGLAAPVTITRDTHGVPSITAASLDDLLFAQGFTTAQDRLFQMEVLRRHAAGTLAEILGPSLVAHDRLQRTLQIRAAADRTLLTLPADQLHQLEAYARGVNAFIASHPTTLPFEFHLLHFTPEPWSPRDSLLVSLVMSQDLATGFPDKLNREGLAGHLPADLLTDLYPVGSWRDHPPTQTSLDLTTPLDKVDEIPLDKTQSSLILPTKTHPKIVIPTEAGALAAHPRIVISTEGGALAAAAERPASRPAASAVDRLTTYAALHAGLCDGCLRGSNNWVVAGTRSASGAPLISNDMHLGLSVPSIWYEAALHITQATTPFDVTGFTLPGVPFVIVGRNTHVAWAFTNTGADVQDVYIEHTRGSGRNTEFQHPDGSWSTIQHHTETIHVRFGHDIALDVLTTTHNVGTSTIETPVISPLYPTERRTLSLAWNVYDPSTLGSPFYAIDAATDAASLVAAFAHFGGPSQNLLYADSLHIGYHALGRIPIRGPAVAHIRTIDSHDLLVPGDAANPRETSEEDDATPNDDAAPSATGVPSGTQLDSLLATTIGSPLSSVPVDALDPTQVWSGYIPYDQLPAVLDPTAGTLATANARITPDAFPYTLTNDWGDPYRAERINVLLRGPSPAGRTGLTPADMLRIQNDVHSDLDLVIAQKLAYAVDHTPHPTRRLQQAADLLRRFNGDLTPDSPAAAIVVATRNELWPMLLAPKIAAHNHLDAHSHEVTDLLALYTWGEKTTALEALLQHTPARWLPPGYTDWNAFLADAVTQALDHAHAPGNLATWRYGDYHPVEDAHPLLGSNGVLARLLGTPFGTGRQPTGGDSTTVKVAGLHFGPSERFTADLADPDHTSANIVTGQSGQPSSPWYLDQFPLWLHGLTLPLPLNHPTITHTLTLTPTR